MRLKNSSNKFNQQFIHLHGKDWYERQRVAGICHAEIMTLLRTLIANKTPLSLLEFDKIVEDEIIKRKCIPTFKNYKGFPNACCISVNNTVVHGIPSNYKLTDGDVVTFDFGTTFEGAIADAADTMIYGELSFKEHYHMINVLRQCLYNSIKMIKPGARLGVIGNAISKTAQDAGFNIINNFGGHSLDWNTPHAFLFVPNKSNRDDGIIIQPGLTLAVEPIIGMGDNSTIVGEDGWTVSTPTIFTHIEHTLFIHEDHVEVMTARADESSVLPNKLYFN